MNDDKQNEAIEANCIIKVNSGFSCSKCGLASKKRYNIKIHLEQKPGEDDISNVDKNLLFWQLRHQGTKSLNFW